MFCVVLFPLVEYSFAFVQLMMLDRMFSFIVCAAWLSSTVHQQKILLRREHVLFMWFISCSDCWRFTFTVCYRNQYWFVSQAAGAHTREKKNRSAVSENTQFWYADDCTLAYQHSTLRTRYDVATMVFETHRWCDGVISEFVLFLAQAKQKKLKVNYPLSRRGFRISWMKTESPSNWGLECSLAFDGFRCACRDLDGSSKNKKDPFTLKEMRDRQKTLVSISVLHKYVTERGLWV